MLLLILENMYANLRTLNSILKVVKNNIININNIENK